VVLFFDVIKDIKAGDEVVIDNNQLDEPEKKSI